MALEAKNMTDPDYGSGNSFRGIGTVFIVGVIGMLIAVPIMALWNMRAPAFFRGETLPKQRAHWVEDSGQ
jgi:hypothetical protein